MARTPQDFHVVETVSLSPHCVRVWLAGDGFDAVAARRHTDAYVKLVFLAPGFDYPKPLDLDVVRDSFPPEAQPVLRTYTVQQVDDENRRIAIDFVVHGDEGVAGPWALAAKPGDPVTVLGPGGAYSPQAEVDFHLFVGDETALPAISAALRALPGSARGAIYVETADAADERDLDRPEGVSLTWVRRVGEDHSALYDAVTSAPWPAGVVQVFVHGEAELTMKQLRPYLRKDRGVPADLASISGYWRHGRTEEGFRRWKRELKQAEEAAPVA
ncbi:siderophore-interacting protein [Flexivirga sp. ID2601S]|uniref:Siderophore-interacting protein n=1 Tax=Flexivirga aerilata TaxID=1656889 RepID=A0A849AQ40_9MICO|nr:siderophore-interacting protein [Flexivirga aerilata]NNG40420.1 siderophore-interacting protein [Flexivirga aerilata]